MLLRNVAKPGLTGSAASSLRDTGMPDASKAVAFSLPSGVSASSLFMEQALKDFYEQTGYQPQIPEEPQPPVEPEPEQPQPEEPQPEEPEVPTDPSSPLPLRVDNLTAEAGRVLTIDLEDEALISAVRILSQTSHGHVSVNTENNLSLVLSENSGNTQDTGFRYEITYADGRTQEVEAKVDVQAGQEPKGWGQGDFYMLETGADGRAVVEHGDNHRKVYVTEGAHGLTRAEIAQAEGLLANQITGKWLADHPEYGVSADKSLNTELGMELWHTTTGRHVDPNSNWLLFERGYTYEDVGRLVSRGTRGESALNPTFIGAYGEGSDPKMGEGVKIYQEKISHVVIQDLDLPGLMALTGENLLLDRLSVKGDNINIHNIKHLTIRDSDIVDVARSEPVNDHEVWHASNNRISGTYLTSVDGAYLDNNLFDRNGWAPGYDYNLSPSKPMPPSYYNHNLYIQETVTDITVRDNIFLRGASFGAQVRPGGVIEGNSFIDNNAALNFFSGANYTLALDNIVTSAGYKKVAHYEGGLSMGIDGQSKGSSLIANIITHRADPNNAAEQAEKTTAHFALNKNQGFFFNDLIVYNWAKEGSTDSRTIDRNTDGLDPTILDRTTIQNFAADLLGKSTATISDLADYLRAQADGKLDRIVDADVINAYFREGFGIDTTLRAAETVRFTPDHRGDGMRWDNRLNWSTEDLPGTQDGDSVHLGGNRVLFVVETATIDDFIFGDFGQIKATSGQLNIGGEISTGKTGNLLQIDNAGQIWVDGYHDEDELRLDLDGGRFANTGDFVGRTQIDVADDAQLLLTTAGGGFDLADGSSLAITGGKAKVGFDGGDGKTATLHLHEGSELSFVANATGLGRISEFHSGAFDASTVTSGIRLDGALSIDLAGLDKNADNTWLLIDADQIIGSFDDINITSLGNNRDALIQVDYIRDEVVLLVSDTGKGSGQIRTISTDEEDFINHTQDGALRALWDDLHASTPLVTDDPI